MKTKTLLLLLVCSIGFSQSHIVLFKQNEIAISSLGHSGYENLLQSSNLKDLKDLNKWLGNRRIHTTVDDLWIVRGARLDLKTADANKLEQESWVARVYEDKTRKFVDPAGAAIAVDDDEMPWGLKKIGMKQLRIDFPGLDGSGVRVGILDTGIQSHHPEFRRTAPDGAVSYIPMVFKDFVAGLASPFDDHGHGTHVAGTIAGESVGIAPNVSLLVAKVFTASGSSTDSMLLKAMQWIFDPDGNPATEDYAQIVSNSWGAGLPKGINDIEDYAPFRLAITTWINGGVIPVFAAGNSGKQPNGMPGGFPEPISVGAIDSKSKVANFSSRGPNFWKVGNWVLTTFKPDVSAPGVEVRSSIPSNTYASWSGTSMATPHVSGVIALALQANHKLKYADIRKLLVDSSVKKNNVDYGVGMLDAHKFISLVKAR